MISNIGQGYAFIRDITYWLAIGNRTDNFIKGLICSEDVLYFVIVSGMFVCFSILKIQLRRERSSFLNKVGRYAVILLVGVMLGYITSRPMMKLYYDSTYNKINTLTKAESGDHGEIEWRIDNNDLREFDGYELSDYT